MVVAWRTDRGEGGEVVFKSQQDGIRTKDWQNFLQDIPRSDQGERKSKRGRWDFS
jgi:hypothetical protein